MADKDTKTRDDGDNASKPNGDNLLLPSSGASLPPAMVHRESHTPMTKAE